MSKGLDKLQEIGAQKIHENTHISREHVQALLHGSFDDFTKIQFLGFISILERDYEIDLDELKERGLEHFDDKNEVDKEDAGVFIAPTKRKSYKKIYIAVVVLVFLFAIIYTAITPSSESVKVQAIDNTIIENAKNNIVEVQEINTTIEDSNISEEEPFVQEEQAVEKSLKVIPKVKLWMGYIDLATYKKYQKLFTDELELDPSKEWLFSLGHGNVSFEIDGELKELLLFVIYNGSC